MMLFMLLLLGLVVFLNASEPNIPNYELQALKDLYYSTEGQFWSYGGNVNPNVWNFSQTDPNPCYEEWYGVECIIDSENLDVLHVSALRLGGNRLFGTLPKSIGNLSFVSILDMEYNFLIHSLPESIGSLSMLVNLSMTFNDLTGTIPVSLWSLRNVNTIKLDGNSFNGSIPSTIENFSCVYLNLASNRLTGPIPEELTTVVGLQHLLLSDNLLTSTLPVGIGLLNELQDLSLDFNNLKGSLPESLYSLKQLRTLVVSQNSFNGNFSSTLGSLSMLTVLDASYNLFTGSLPGELCSLTELIKAAFEFNELTGSLPHDIGRLQTLQYFSIDNNHLTNNLPGGIYSLANLITLSAGSNDLTGPIQDDIKDLMSLANLILNDNHFNGSIPDLSKNTQLAKINFEFNQFSGTLPEGVSLLSIVDLYLAGNLLELTIPTSYCSFSDLQTLDVSFNQITGTIPNCIDAKDMPLEYLIVNNNHLHGSFPSLFNFSSGLQGGFVLSSNLFSGTVPSEISNLNSNMNRFELGNNIFSGTIPSSMSQFQHLSYLDLAQNLFVGTLPPLTNFGYLKVFFVNDNQFSGRLSDVLHFVSTDMYLIDYDASNNQFTGPLPTVPFLITNFQAFAAVSNCFTGALPSEICGAKTLLALALDGLRSASSCQNRFFPQSMNINSYWLDGEITGGIPECLFDLPKLRILHLSGNGFSGSLSADLSLASENLTDVSLSHNNLKGAIPVVLQQRQFTNLDLSYNKFDSTLQDEFASYGSDASLSLEVNRLSGNIPPSLKSMRNISVLDGNILSCDADRSELPDHDPKSRDYECGSNTFNYSMYTWIGLFGMLNLFGVFMMTMKSGESAGNNNGSWMRPFERRDNKLGCVNVVELGSLLSQYRVLCLCITVFIVVVALPVNSVLSVYFNTYTYEYAWTVTSAYLSGVTPAICLLCLVVVLFCVVGVAVQWTVFRLRRRRMLESDDQTASRSWQQWCAVVGIVLCDMVLMVGMNIAYVYIFTQYDASVVQIAQISLSLFKVAWNNAVIRIVFLVNSGVHAPCSANKSMPALVDHLSRESMVNPVSPDKMIGVGVAIMLFNNLAAPFIATSLVSSNCFYNVISTPPAVEVSYVTADCLEYLSSDLGKVCGEYAFGSAKSTSYIPPFIYSYQCSSTFITTYVSIYVFMLIFIGFIAPAWKLVLLETVNNMTRKSWIHSLAVKLLPKILRSDQNRSRVSISDETSDDWFWWLKSAVGNGKIFESDVFAVQLVNLLVVLVTFGVVVPAVAVVGVVTVYSATYFAQWCIGRYIVSGEQDDVAGIDKDCAGAVMMLSKSLWLLVPFVVIFYSFFLFDTLGDEVGWRRAIWLPVSIVSVLFVVWLLRKCRMYTVFGRMTRESRRSWGSDRRSELDEEAVDMDEKLLSS